MDDLQNQRIGALEGAWRKDAYIKLGRIVAARIHDGSDDQAAKTAGFGSTTAMYQQLQTWGLGELAPAPKEGSREAQADERRQATGKGKRKAKNFGGPKTPLPPAERAIPHFRRTLAVLNKRLDKLRGRDEYLQSKRFAGRVERNGKKLALGAGPTPPAPLTTFIAIEALVSGYARCPAITHLIDVLHPSELIETDRGRATTREPDPEKVDMQRLDQAVRDLRKQAGVVAKLIRGVKLGPGSPPEEVTVRGHAVNDLVKQRAREGYSDEQICEEANRRFDRVPLGLEEDFTLEDIRYLKNSEFEDPAQESN